MAALESAVLSFGVGFHDLDLSQAFIDVRIENAHAAAFYRRLRMAELRRDQRDIYFTYCRSQFDADRAGYTAILKGR